MIKVRNSRGNILVLVVLSIGIIIAVGVLGFSFNGFLFGRTRAQNQIDALALSFASKINAGDRVGQINELEECSRELVHVSRTEFENCNQEEFSGLQPLCYELLDEARSGQQMVDRERKNQIELISSDLQRLSSDYNNSCDGQNGLFNLRWIQTSQPKIEAVSVGRYKNLLSSVKSLDVLTDLAEFDRQQGNVDPVSKLFGGNIDAKLRQDTDLKFEISALPAYVQNTCSPARNANAEDFIGSAKIFDNGKPSPFGSSVHIPNSVQLTCVMNATMGNNQRSSIRLVSTAITNGATASSQ